MNNSREADAEFAAPVDAPLTLRQARDLARWDPLRVTLALKNTEPPMDAPWVKRLRLKGAIRYVHPINDRNSSGGLRGPLLVAADVPSARVLTPEQKRALVERLVVAWQTTPRQRLGQLFDSACHGQGAEKARELPFVEDAIEQFAERMRDR